MHRSAQRRSVQCRLVQSLCRSPRTLSSVRRGAAALLIAAAGIASLLDVAVARAQALNGEVRTLLSNAKLSGSGVVASVSVVDCQTGTVLASVDDRVPVTPASNIKLLTSATALLVLGKDFAFTTKFVRSGDKLIIVGDGDPGLADPQLLADMKLSLDDLLGQIVMQIGKETGEKIREVVVDDRVFDKDQVHPTWPKNQLDAWYCAPVSGVNFYTNVVEVFVGAGSRTGAPPAVRTLPSGSAIEIRNTAKTVTADNTDIRINRADGKNVFSISGSVAARGVIDKPYEVTVHEPGMLLGQVLAERLMKAGLTAPLPTTGAAAVHSAMPIVRFAGAEEVFDVTKVAAMIKTPLMVALSRCNVNSHNLYAEALLKRVGFATSGQQGSWSNGAAVVRMKISELLGPEAGDVSMADGSGMSQDNRVTTYLLTHWMAAISNLRDPETSSIFASSMADMEAEKIAKRFHGRKLDNRLTAKTGFIRGVQGLSGYLIHPETGRRVAYSVILNHTDKAPAGAKIKDFHEEVVVAADKWLTRNPGSPAVRSAPAPVVIVPSDAVPPK